MGINILEYNSDWEQVKEVYTIVIINTQYQVAIIMSIIKYFKINYLDYFVKDDVFIVRDLQEELIAIYHHFILYFHVIQGN